MNDEFLYRLQVNPPAEFAVSLKARLDRQSGRAKRVVRWGLPLMIFGVAFALALPDVRHAIARLFSGVSSADVASANGARALDSSSPAMDDVNHALPPGVSVPSATPTSSLARRGTRVGTPDSEARVDAAHLLTESPVLDPSDVMPAAGSRSAASTSSAVPHSSTREDEAQEAINLRRSLFQVMREVTEPLIAMGLGERRFDFGLVAREAQRLEQLAPMITEMFATDTRGFGVETNALDGIWKDNERFVAKADDLLDAAQALEADAQTGKLQVMAGAMSRVVETCVECHKEFRRNKPQDALR